MMHLEVLADQQKEILPALHNLPRFYLAGGTALALQIGHRLSVDFDFFTARPLEKKVFHLLRQRCQSWTVTPLVNNPDELTVLIQGVKVTLLHYPFPVIHPLVSENGLELLGVPETAATKAYTIGRRGEFKDYVDMYFIIQGQHATLADILKLAEKKYGDQFNSRLFLEQLTYLEDVEKTPLTFMASPVDVPQLQNFFNDQIRALSLE